MKQCTIKIVKKCWVLILVLTFFVGNNIQTSASEYSDLENQESSKYKEYKRLNSQLEGVSAELSTLVHRLDNIEKNLIPQTKRLVQEYREKAEKTASEAASLKVRYENAVKVLNQIKQQLKTATSNATNSKDEIMNSIRTKLRNGDGASQITEIIKTGSFEEFLQKLDITDIVNRNLSRVFSESKLVLSQGENNRIRIDTITNIVLTLKKQADEANLKAQKLKASAEEKQRYLESLETELSSKRVEYQAAKKRLKEETAQAKKEYDSILDKMAAINQDNTVDHGPIPTKGWFGSPLSNMNVASPFGWRCLSGDAYGCFHMGTDFYASCGQRIYAAQSGPVVQSGWNGLAGNSVIINHGRHGGVNLQTWYMHMTSTAVSVGQNVRKGQLIGYVGETGNAFGCHLHLTIIANGQYVDPMRYY